MSDTGHQGIDDAKRAGLPGLFAKHGRRVSLGLWVARPARVVTYDAATQRADLSLEVLTVVRGNTAATADLMTPLPPMPLSRVPVMMPSGLGRAARVSMPLGPGDTGLVVFLDRSLEDWKRTGVAGAPKGARAHSPADGVFFPGLWADVAPLGALPPLVPAPDPTALELEAAVIKLGALAVQPAVLGTALVDLVTTFATVVAAANTTWGGNPATGVAFSTALGGALVDLATGAAGILSTKVRVQ